MNTQTRPVIAVIGGTGPQGRGLAYRFARAGHHVILGSRSADRAVAVAAQVNERLLSADGRGVSSGAMNADAVDAADLVLLAVPYDGHDPLVQSLADHLVGKTVISCVNPLVFDKRGVSGRVVDGGEGSAAESAQRLASGATVVGAFHNVSAVRLWGDEEYVDDDVIVVGDSDDAKRAVIDLAAAVTGRKGIDGGKLRLARVLEPLTAVLISINRRYKVHAGVRITGMRYADGASGSVDD